MARLQAKSFDNPDEVRRIPNGKIEVFQLDDVVIGRTVFEPGWRWSVDVKPIAGTASCQYHHVGVSVSGRVGVRMDDGTTLEIPPNSVLDIPPGHDSWVIGDEPWVSYDVAGMRTFARVDEGSQRILGAILFTDIVDSTATAERLGSGAWQTLLARHNERSVMEVDRFRGRVVKNTGDGILALFDGSERAVRAAIALARASTDLGLSIRAGIHTGEIELAGTDVHGLAVNMAARVMGAAGSQEVFVSSTTADLLAGSGLEFRDAGLHDLKGITGARQLFAVVDLT